MLTINGIGYVPETQKTQGAQGAQGADNQPADDIMHSKKPQTAGIENKAGKQGININDLINQNMKAKPF